MTFDDKAVRRISDSISIDLIKELGTLREDFINESPEFAKIAGEKEDELLEIQDKLAVAFAETDLPIEEMNIFIKGYQLNFNKETDSFEFPIEIERIAREYAIEKFKIYDSWNNGMKGKRNYVSTKVLGLISSLDNTMSYESVEKFIRSNIDLNEILLDQTIV